MAEQLNTTSKTFDPLEGLYALPNDWQGAQEEEEIEEPIEDEEEVSVADNLSEDTDVFGDFVISQEGYPKSIAGEDERSYTVPAEDETKDEQIEGKTQFESLKETSKKKVKELGGDLVDFGKNVGFVFKDQAKGVVRGLGETGKHLNNLSRLNYVYAWSDEKLNELGVGSEYSIEWNVEGSKGFDPDKPLVYMSKNSENPSYERNYWTSGDFLLEEPQTLSGQIIKPVTSFLTMMAITRGFGGYGGAPATWGGRAIEDALVGNLAFSPEGPRLYEYFTDMIGEIPVESDVGIKLANFLRNKDDDPMYLKQLRVAADSIFIEAGLTKLGGVLVLAAQTVKKMKGIIEGK